MRRMSREALRSLGDVVHVLQETIDCHKVVKVFGGQDYELGVSPQRADPARLHHARRRSGGVTTPITHARGARARGDHLPLDAGHARHPHHGRRFASFITAMLMLLRAAQAFDGDQHRAAARARRGGERVRDDRHAGRGGYRHGRCRGRAGRWSSKASASLFRRTEPALVDINLHIRPGETIALVGGSGGGKTTLVNLLPRFYAPTTGRILLDGNDIQTVT